MLGSLSKLQFVLGTYLYNIRYSIYKSLAKFGRLPIPGPEAWL
jgi:hypothetical protein